VLRRVVVANRRARKPRLVFAIVVPHFPRHHLLRYWMASAGIHPDRAARVVVVPPPMVNYLKAVLIPGYCVGEP
jgi:ABC-type nitrate/sulfonate/bicarbonate transport system substrate-binding protein